MDSTVSLVVAARGLRALGDGFVSLTLPLYLLALGYSPLEVGLVSTATLLGSAALSLTIGMHATRIGYRRALLGTALLMLATGIAFTAVRDFWPLLVVAFVGTLNPSSGDVSAFLPLEHAVLSDVVSAKARTRTFARYSLVGALCGALGALLAAVPQMLADTLHVPWRVALQSMFVFYAALGLASWLLYRRLPVRAGGVSESAQREAPLHESRRIVLTLAALFSVDAFAGGLIVQSMLSLWLVQRFALAPAELGVLFSATSLLAAASYLAAVPLAQRFGLVNTMVFTHIPSSVALIAIPFVSDVHVAVALLLVRSALSQMDVPTRSSYVMAVVTPVERPAAASTTAVPRSLAAAGSPLLAGYLLGLSPFGWPLVLAGAIKIAYDLMLLALFRNVHPPEEASPHAPHPARRAQ
ncbi:MAG TPA: MFS transporter [Casimicrobiaceae bacterium]|nr:MFS transporter [Casimicrobiaceae bacterium]